MTFNSLPFLIFLPLSVLLYYSLAPRYRWILLLGLSYFFYMWWNPAYIVLIVVSTLIDFFAARAIEQQKSRKNQRKLLMLSLVTNLGLLFSFKYYGFFTKSAEGIFKIAGFDFQFPYMDVLLPVGISFYTFQTLSYTLDVFYGRQKADQHLGYFALYVCYFPQLVAGPIERYDRLAPQLRKDIKPEYDNFSRGLRLILFGLFVKMVIADNMAPIVDEVYKNPEILGSWHILTGLVFYSFQIYADFYGYSTIAVGTALLMGVSLMDNFKTPYLSRNISEFWQRWHISLSTWFRDYLYIPLGGNQVKYSFWILNILIVFTISGLWHGANYTFVIWGSLFGVIYIFERFFSEQWGWRTPEAWGIQRIPGVIKTFVLVTLAWVFFRSPDIGTAGKIFSGIYSNWGIADPWFPATEILVWLGLFIALDILLFNDRFDYWAGRKPAWARWTIYAVLLFGITAFGGTDNQPFIYFQF